MVVLRVELRDTGDVEVAFQNGVERDVAEAPERRRVERTASGQSPPESGQSQLFRCDEGHPGVSTHIEDLAKIDDQVCFLMIGLEQLAFRRKQAFGIADTESPAGQCGLLGVALGHEGQETPWLSCLIGFVPVTHRRFPP